MAPFSSVRARDYSILVSKTKAWGGTMKIQFDEKNIKSLGKKYITEVELYDFRTKRNVYSGPLDQDFLDILRMCIEEGNLPEDFKWHIYQNTDYDNYTHMVQVAVNGNGYQYLKVDLRMRKIKAAPNHDGQFFLYGLIAGLFGMSFWETLGALFVYNEIKRRDRNE